MKSTSVSPAPTVTRRKLPGTGVDAVVSQYGGRTEQFPSEADNVNAPFMTRVGEDGKYISRDAEQSIKTAFNGRPDKTIHTYPGQAHAFSRRHGTRCDDEAAELASARTVGFFRKHMVTDIVAVAP